jgi:toxin-antitoxin system PIN domain toxin
VISIDTNILLYAQNADCAEHDAAFAFLGGCAGRDDVVICELVLVELYLLLRNPAVLKRPLGPKTAADICAAYRANPRWRLAGQPGFARRRIFDARIVLTLFHHGVTDLATANVAGGRRSNISVTSPADCRRIRPVASRRVSPSRNAGPAGTDAR